MWLVFDLDSTLLINLRPELFPQVKKLLLKLHQEGYTMFLCSFNREGRDILWQTSLLSCFRDTRCDVGGPKAPIIQELSSTYNLPLAECRFFDDCEHNIKTCTDAGIQSIKVDPEVGVTETQIRNS